MTDGQWGRMMAMAMRESEYVYESLETVDRATLVRVAERMEQELHRQGKQIQVVRAEGGDAALLERRWQNMLATYERISGYLAATQPR